MCLSCRHLSDRISIHEYQPIVTSKKVTSYLADLYVDKDLIFDRIGTSTVRLLEASTTPFAPAGFGIGVGIRDIVVECQPNCWWGLKG